MGFNRPPYRYALAPLRWVTDIWKFPASAVGGIDLRPLSAQAAAGGTPQGVGFFAALQPMPGGTLLGTALNLTEANATAAMRDAYQAATGYRPTTGTKIVDLPWEHLTAGSDPTGQAGPKPLRPTSAGFLEMRLGGHSVVKRERFRYGKHPHTERVRAAIQHDVEQMWEESDGDEAVLRVLDMHRVQFGVDDWKKEFVKPRLRKHMPHRLPPHATTITESFNKADSTTLGPDLTWSEVSGGWEVVSNRAAKTTAVINRDAARAESVLSSDNHYAQALVYYPTTGIYVGPACRFAAAALTYYNIHSATGDTNLYLVKVVAGTGTNLSFASHTPASGSLCKVQANGSTITAYYAGAEITSSTDSAITGNVRCGIAQSMNNAGGTFDSFEASDLAAATKAPPVFRRKRFFSVRAA